MNNTSGMSLIVKTVTRLTVGLILIYGIYIVLQGHISPGGGFAGGIIIALSFIHLMLAYGRGAVIKKLNEARSLFFASLSAIVFLSLAVIGFMRPVFIPLYDIALAVLVGTGVFSIVLALVSLIGDKSE